MKILLVIIYCLKFSVAAETVVCSFEILHDICAQICAGTEINVTSIVPKKSDPHLFQPKPSDSKKIFKASLIIINGLRLEGWIEGIIKSSGYSGEVVVASASIKPRMIGNIPDPHIWHDPTLVIVMVDNIKNALLKTFPNYAKQIEGNAVKLIADLQKLDQQIKSIFSQIPENRRLMLTTHDAFSYFSKRYEIKVYSPQGVSTGDDPSAAEVSKLIKKIKKYNITAIFLEQLANPKIIKTIVQEISQKLQGTLHADTLSAGKTLQDTLLENANTIAQAMIAGSSA